MRSIIVLLLILGIVISGCISNPLRQVPVVNVNVTFTEKQGYPVAETINLTQKTVDYAARPQTRQTFFPAIVGRTMVSKGKNSTVGEWEMKEYNGPGVYSFDIGFVEGHEPAFNDTVLVSIYIMDKKGETIFFGNQYILWNP